MITPRPISRKHSLKSLKKIIPYLRPYTTSIIFAMLFAAVGTIFNIYGPRKIGLIMEMVTIQAGTTGIDLKQLAIEGTTLAGIYIISALFIYCSHYLITGVAQNLSYRLRKDISAKINRLPLSYFDSRSIGDVMSRVTNDVDNISHNLNQSANTVITSITTIIGIFYFMIITSIQLTLVALVTVPLSAMIMRIVVRHSQRHFFAQQKQLGEINGHIEEMYGAHLVVKAFNGEERAIHEFESINKRLYQSAWKSQFISSLTMPLIRTVGNLGYVAICIIGALLALRTGNIAALTSFLLYIRRFNQPMNEIAQITNILQSAAASSERVAEFLEEEEMEDESHKTMYLNPKDVRGDVEFRNVQFGYKPDQLVIKNFNCKIKAGQTVAIVGPTGAGKTTLINLLMRFYETTSGDIFIDGINTKDLTRKNVRELFGMVLQDTWLFEGTIMENLKFGRPSATDEEVIEACQAAHVHHFIQSLPRGYNMVLDESANIASGQKQLLTIARAMVENAPMLILDEATSNVDTRTELLIQKAMDRLMEGRTSFIIAHRLSTIRDADLILVIRDGNIVEQGTHEELLEKNGFYAELYRSQFAGKNPMAPQEDPALT